MASKIGYLKNLIQEGEQSGDPINWDADTFLLKLKLGKERSDDLANIRQALIEGEQSGFTEKSVHQIWGEARGESPDQ